MSNPITNPHDRWDTEDLPSPEEHRSILFHRITVSRYLERALDESHRNELSDLRDELFEDLSEGRPPEHFSLWNNYVREYMKCVEELLLELNPDTTFRCVRVAQQLVTRYLKHLQYPVDNVDLERLDDDRCHHLASQIWKLPASSFVALVRRFVEESQQATAEVVIAGPSTAPPAHGSRCSYPGITTVMQSSLPMPDAFCRKLQIRFYTPVIMRRWNDLSKWLLNQPLGLRIKVEELLEQMPETRAPPSRDDLAKAVVTYAETYFHRSVSYSLARLRELSIEVLDELVFHIPDSGLVFTNTVVQTYFGILLHHLQTVVSYSVLRKFVTPLPPETGFRDMTASELGEAERWNSKTPRERVIAYMARVFGNDPEVWADLHHLTDATLGELDLAIPVVDLPKPLSPSSEEPVWQWARLVRRRLNERLPWTGFLDPNVWGYRDSESREGHARFYPKWVEKVSVRHMETMQRLLCMQEEPHWWPKETVNQDLPESKTMTSKELVAIADKRKGEHLKARRLAFNPGPHWDDDNNKQFLKFNKALHSLVSHHRHRHYFDQFKSAHLSSQEELAWEQWKAQQLKMSEAQWQALLAWWDAHRERRQERHHHYESYDKAHPLR